MHQPSVIDPNRQPFLSAISAAGILVLALAGSGTSTSNSPSGLAGTPVAPSSAASAPQGSRVGTSFTGKDTDGNIVRTTLLKMINPAQGQHPSQAPDSGKQLVAVVFNVTAITGNTTNEHANSDAGITVDGASYMPILILVRGYSNWVNGTVVIQQGPSLVGEVTFQIPIGLSASNVQWNMGGGLAGDDFQWNV